MDLNTDQIMTKKTIATKAFDLKVTTNTVIEGLYKCRLNYESSHKSLLDKEYRMDIRKLWLQHLAKFEPKIIAAAIDEIIGNEKYFPTVYVLKQYCMQAFCKYQGIPELEQAYYEALNADTPKHDNKWSHPIVYLTGKTCGWEYLLDTDKNTALKLFAEIYTKYQNLVLGGKEFGI